MSMFVLVVALTSGTQLCWSQPPRTCWPYPVQRDPHTVRRPCFQNKCYCSTLTADCSSNAGHLSFIPKLPDSIIFLNFSNNALAKIDGVDFFANVSTRLHSLDLYNNGLTYIAPGSFRRFTNLTKLLIGGNKLNYSALGAVFSVTTLETLDIACGGLGPVPPGIFHLYALPSLTFLELSYNDIRHLDMKVLQPLQSLNSLLLWNNKLGELTPSYLPSLSHLGLHENALVDFPDTCNGSTGEPFYPSLTMLHLDYNIIDSIHDPVCLPKLQFLDVESNRFQYIPSDTFSGARFPVLSQLWVATMEIKWEYISAGAFNNTALTFLSMGFNKLDFANLVNERAFEGCLNIQQLFLDNTTFEFVSDENLHNLLAPMPHLERLHLGNSKKSKINRRTFSTLQNLKRLYLYGNSISFLPVGAFDKMAKLQMLRLENNLITTVSSDVFSLQTRSRLRILDLSGNPFVCSCDILWFRQWLQDSPGLFQDFYGEGYRCTDEQKTTLQEFYLSEQACLLSRTTSNLISSVICILLLFFFVFTVVFGYRWHIRLVFYEICRARSARRDRERRRQQIHYEFDVFVSYAEEDLPWVQRELLPALEARWGLRLCVHQRDFVPGKHIVDNIADCVDASDRILMVLSPHFAISPWCQFELRYCQGIAMDRDDVMVLVTLQDPGSFDVTGCMMAVLRTTTYIQWGEGGDVTDSFWGRLRLALDDVIPTP